MDQARAVLKDTFGFSAFRLTQEKVIERLLVDNANCLVLYPTGGGKSLCYQIPGLCLDGLTLVISPLIALMKDQVDALKKRGALAASLDSSLCLEETRDVKASVRDGTLKILYVAPERLNNESFIEMMRYVKISLLAIDESHCISQWGSSFRPEYLKIARFTEEFAVERVLCLTATATPSIASDICKSFHIDEEHGIFRTPMYRPNLDFLVKTATSQDDKIRQIIPMLENRTGPVIIYVTLQRHATDAAEALKDAGFPAVAYHAGMRAEDRKRVQDEFMEADDAIVVATIAFGMGIDKNNIRQVIHMNMPKTLENYSQEVGRAGRDGLKSTCTVFLCPPDIPLMEGFARGETCSKSSIILWIQAVAMKELDPDEKLSFNLYEQSKIFDIRANVLNLLYAELELKHGYIRAITPLYAIYDLSPISPGSHEALLSDTSPAGRATYSRLKPKRNGGWSIDVVEKADDMWPRERLAAQITKWEADGLIDVKGSQVRARYQVLKPLPKDAAAQEEIAEAMFQGMLTREEDAVARLFSVVDFATQEICLAQSLASYFGDPDVVPNRKCGHCQFCKTNKGTPFSRETIKTEVNPEKMALVLKRLPYRDDPRLLARLAFGVISPRISGQNIKTSDPIFGCMVDVRWEVLIEAFTKVCEEAGYANEVVSTPATSGTTVAGRKRSASTRGGGAAKRGKVRTGVAYSVEE